MAKLFNVLKKIVGENVKFMVYTHVYIRSTYFTQ
jgi:hypothetical protein